MESTHNHDLKVGIFVTLGIFILMASVILLGGDKILFKSYSSYRLVLKQSQGLGPGSVISLAGIKIGNIKKIQFRSEGENLVNYPLEAILEIESDYSNQITTSTEAQIKTQGALGDKYIYLIPGNLTDRKLNENEEIISSGSSDFLDALAEKSDDITKIGDVIKEVHTLLVSINEKNLTGSTMENLHSSSEKLNLLLSEVHELVKDLRGNKNENQLRESVVHLSSILKKIDSGQGSLGALINDSTLHNKLVEFIGSSPRRKLLKPLIRTTILESEVKK